MLRFRSIFPLFICLPIYFTTFCVLAEEEIEDLVEIYESDDKIIAILRGRKSVSLRLKPREEVLWSGSDGYLGALLTNQRFYVIFASSPRWQIIRLTSKNSEQRVAHISPYLALLVTPGDRAIGFDAKTGRFVEARLPAGEEVLLARLDRQVAVVATPSRALGWAAGTTTFKEIRFGIRETVKGSKITASKATIRTSDRLLTFESHGAKWREHRL